MREGVHAAVEHVAGDHERDDREPRLPPSLLCAGSLGEPCPQHAAECTPQHQGSLKRRKSRAPVVGVLAFRDLTIRRSLSVIRRATGYVAPAALAFLGLVGAAEGNFQAARASKPC